jgi:acetyl-CoA synthetase
MMMTVEADPVGSVRTVASGGESLGASIVEWADDIFEGAAVHEGYGQTEANMLAGDCTALFESREGKIGRAGPGHEVGIVDPETAEADVPRGETGEIAVQYEGNPVCFVEYWNQPEKTDAKVRNSWLLTEDLGRMDEDGYISFEGRTMSSPPRVPHRAGGDRGEPRHPRGGRGVDDDLGVEVVGVIGALDDTRGEVPVAFVVLAEGREQSDALREELQQHVRDRLADHGYPRAIEFIDQLPMTPTGKIQRFELEDRYEEQAEP